jgi:hypothetical protein
MREHTREPPMLYDFRCKLSAIKHGLDWVLRERREYLTGDPLPVVFAAGFAYREYALAKGREVL